RVRRARGNGRVPDRAEVEALQLAAGVDLAAVDPRNAHLLDEGGRIDEEAHVVARLERLAEQHPGGVAAVENRQNGDLPADGHRHARRLRGEIDRNGDPRVLVRLEALRIEDPHRLRVEVQVDDRSRQEVESDQPRDVAEMRGALVESGFDDDIVQNARSERDRVDLVDVRARAAADAVDLALADALGADAPRERVGQGDAEGAGVEDEGSFHSVDGRIDENAR